MYYDYRVTSSSAHSWGIRLSGTPVQVPDLTSDFYAVERFALLLTAGQLTPCQLREAIDNFLAE